MSTKKTYANVPKNKFCFGPVCTYIYIYIYIYIYKQTHTYMAPPPRPLPFLAPYRSSPPWASSYNTRLTTREPGFEPRRRLLFLFLGLSRVSSTLPQGLPGSLSGPSFIAGRTLVRPPGGKCVDPLSHERVALKFNL